MNPVLLLLQEPKPYPWGKEFLALDPDGYQWSFVEFLKGLE